MDKKIIACMKNMISTNGPDFLTENPFRVYKELGKIKGTDRKLNGAILCYLVSGLPEKINADMEAAGYSERIQQECGLNEEMSDRVAAVFSQLYSHENEQEWNALNKKGLKEFLRADFTYEWEGLAVWEVSNGSVSCHYKAEISLKPTESAVDDKLKKLLVKNPFMTKEAIHEYFEKRLKEYLDMEFEEYCTCDDYYEPVVEDFDAEYYVEAWSKENGFDYISCEGNGYDDGYEPDFRRGW
jgi:hypothetical protein